MPSTAQLYYNAGLQEGEDSQLGLTAGGMFGDYYLTTTDTLVFNGPCVVVGFIVTVITAVGTIALTDAVAAAGTPRYTIAVATAANTVVNFPPMRFNTGCYIDYLGGATGSVLWIVKGA